MAQLPLEGVRVLDLTRQLPGPYATLLLADFGADVIKVEDAGPGDFFRHIKPLVKGHGGRHLLVNRNKRGVALNLKDPRGREAFYRLADTAQVVFEQFRPGVVAKLGIDYETLSTRNPGLVYCSLSGFGQDGPYRDAVMHDPGYLGLAGILGLFGPADGPPVMPGVSVGDYAAALISDVAILMALRHAERTGQGQYIDTSIFDAAVSILVMPGSLALFTGRGPSRGQERQTGRFPCAAVYECADGCYIVLSAQEAHFWANLCRFFGREDFIPHQLDEQKREEMFAFFRPAFRARPRDEWVRILWDKDVCISPVHTVDEALADPQVRHRGMVAEVDTPGVGVIPQLGIPAKLSATPGSIRFGAPMLGQHTAEILSELGYPDGEIEALLDDGVVKCEKPR